MVIAVVIDEPEGIRYGGVVAAPAFKAIAEQILPYLGSYPKGTTYLVADSKGKTNPVLFAEGLPSGNARQVAGGDFAEAPGVMPDFSGKSIRQVVQTAQRLGLELRFVGSGKAVAQNPPAGYILQGGNPGRSPLSTVFVKMGFYVDLPGASIPPAPASERNQDRMFLENCSEICSAVIRG